MTLDTTPDPAGPRLATERLVLRRWRAADLAPFAAMNADPDVMRYFVSGMDRAGSDGLVERFEDHFRRRGFGMWAVDVANDGRFAGFVGLQDAPADLPFAPAVEIGWRLATSHWRRGYATEAAAAAADLGFGTLGLDEIVSFTSVVNRPSRAVMERLAMRYDGDFQNPRVPVGHPLRPHALYRLRRDDPRPRRDGR